MTPGFRIRPAGPQDVDAVVELWFERDPRPLDELRERASRWFARDQDDDLHVVAEVAGRAVAWARATWMDATEGAPENCVPAGWYLLGLNVGPRMRRCGLGRALTAARLDWLRGRSDTVWYFTNSKNRASLELHASFGFVEARRGVWFPGISGPDAEIVLLRAILPAPGATSG